MSHNQIFLVNVKNDAKSVCNEIVDRGQYYMIQVLLIVHLGHLPRSVVSPTFNVLLHPNGSSLVMLNVLSLRDYLITISLFDSLYNDCLLYTYPSNDYSRLNIKNYKWCNPFSLFRGGGDW